MSNGDFQHERDDELLSAYIDGELSEAERAAVEARLAADPDAQHLVHQLRSVSQSVQRLPLEAVGRDLSEAILRRAEALKPTPLAAKNASPNSVSDVQDLRGSSGVFHSRRPWIWASLAVAAGLMIMFLQQAPENDRVVMVAQQSEGRSADRARQMERSQFGREAGQEPPPAAVDPAVVAKSDSEPAQVPMAAPTTALDALPPAKLEVLSDERAANDSRYRGGGKTGETKDQPQAPATTTSPASAPVVTDLPTDEEIRKGSALSLRSSPPPANVSGAAGASTPARAAPLPPAPAPPSPEGEKSKSLAVDSTRGAAIAGEEAAPPAPANAAAGGERGRGFGGGRGGAAFDDANGRLYAQAEGKSAPVVVHVVANADSFRQQSIDKVLSKRGVVFESTDQSQQLTANAKRSGGAISGLEAGGERLNLLSELNRAAGSDTDFDLVLVEAPKATIASCLTDLNKDATNYVSVEIVEPDTSKESVARDKSTGTDFGKYNRGVVSPEQKQAFESYYSQLDAVGKTAASSEAEGVDRFAIELGATGQRELAEQPKNVPSETRGADVQARARRLSRLDLKADESKVAEPQGVVAGSPVGKPPEILRRSQADVRAADGVTTTGDNLRVLFVICAQPAAPAAATSAPPAEASPPPQKSSK